MMRGGKGLYVGERIAAVALWAASVWPMWRWWARRLSEPFDADAVAWCVFVAFAAMLWRRAGTAAAKVPLPTWKWLWAAGFLALFHLARTALPPTASGVFAVLAGLPLLLPEGTAQGPVPPPLAALALMGLPSAMILDFLLGYPLRVFATRFAALLLSAAGLPVARSGVELSVDGASVFVDAPCAGVRMLGAGLVLAFSLAQTFGFRFRRTALLAVAGLAAVILANVARVTVLALFAAEGVALSRTAHEVVGCLALLPGAALCALAAFAMARRGR
jgi:exosortase/archaeosortase family protein